jgi:uncharacterized protein with HEPN domain
MESIDLIGEFVGEMDFSPYKKTQAAVERKIQILTEAVIRLEMEGPDSFPEIDWKAYRGMGNFLRHSYHRVSDEIVWTPSRTIYRCSRKSSKGLSAVRAHRRQTQSQTMNSAAGNSPVVLSAARRFAIRLSAHYSSSLLVVAEVQRPGARQILHHMPQ